MAEAKGIPVSDWSWWVGSADSVDVEGIYELNECATREDAVDYGALHVEAGERFHIIEARTRKLQADDEFQPFAEARNHAVFEVNDQAEAIEVGG